MNESVLDYPVEDLDSTVWEKDSVGEYRLTDYAKEKVFNVVNWMARTLGVTKYGANITGSITSNTYSETADIDIHVNSKEIPVDQHDRVNQILRQRFDEEFKKNGDHLIGKHPIEVYFQSNPYQDMMSVGCYDILNGKWIVGPEMKPMDYDPYVQFYEDDMRYVNDVISEIRNVILQCLESATVILQSKNFKFKEFEFTRLLDLMRKSDSVFQKARDARKVYSTPRSKEDALQKRNSKKWKIADSSFKLMDKFGYLQILKGISEILKTVDCGDYDVEDVSTRVIDVIRNGFHRGELTEDQKLMISDMVDESFGSAFSKVALLVSILSIPDLTDNNTFASQLKDIPKQELKADNKKVNMALNAASVEQKDFKGISFTNLTNLIATIIYNEAAIDYKRYGDVKSLIAIADTIDNRSGGDPNNYTSEITRDGQYYSSKHIVGGTDDKTYKQWIPQGSHMKEAWNLSNKIAVDLLKSKVDKTKRRYPNVIGDRNMIANKGLDAQSALDSWGNDCDLKIGSHTFGYAKDQDGYLKYHTEKPKNLNHVSVKKNNVNQYVVKQGDTLWGIARRNKTTVSKILSKNKGLKANSKLKIGQKLNI